jgi:hypothetical protein
VDWLRFGTSFDEAGGKWECQRGRIVSKLLISVRNQDEALQAYAGGADIIDIKDPRYGSLGAPVPSVIQSIVHTVPTAMVSVAAGDLPNWPGTVALAIRGALTIPGIRWVKVGLVGPYALSSMEGVWQALKSENVSQIIPVFYLDQDTWPVIKEATLAAAEIGIAAVVYDTLSKGQGFDFWVSGQRLASLIRIAQDRGMWVGIAGHVTRSNLHLALDAGADVVGVRTAVCRNEERNGPLDARLVREFKQLIHPEKCAEEVGGV